MLDCHTSTGFDSSADAWHCRLSGARYTELTKWNPSASNTKNLRPCGMVRIRFFRPEISVNSPVSYFDSHSAPRTAPYNKLHKLPIEGFFSQTLAPSWPEEVAPYWYFWRYKDFHNCFHNHFFLSFLLSFFVELLTSERQHATFCLK